MDFAPSTEHQDDSDPINITAMVDVVFMLLAFFVLTTSFLAGERDLAVGHREQTKTAGASAEDLPESVMVKLSPSETGHVVVTLGQSVLGEDAFAKLTGSLQQINLPQTPVVIASHPNVSVAQVGQAIEAVLASPMKRLSLQRLGEGT